MYKKKLPNSTTVLVLGIISLLGCCCNGLPGVITGLIALNLAKKDTALYNSNPDEYDGFQNIKTGKILAIIGLVLSAIALLATIWAVSMFGWEALANPELMQERMLEMQQNQ